MKRIALGLLVLAVAPGCGGVTSDPAHVKTPEEMIAEQERLAAEQERESQEHDQYQGSLDSEETDLEKTGKFDKKQAKLELTRAGRSAEDCTGVIEGDKPTGTAKVTLVFDNEGHVKEGTISDPFNDTPLGKCVLNAMTAVIVPPFEGPPATIEWDVDLTGEKKEGKQAEK